MASELALAIAQRNKETTQTVGALRLANDVDAELQEVREVLEGIRGFYGSNDCWCDSEDEAPHFGHCQRARELMKRLIVK